MRMDTGRNLSDEAINSATEPPPDESGVRVFLLVTEVVSKWWFIFTVTFGVPGNVMSLLVTLKKDNRRISTCIYMAGLAVVDTLVLIGVVLYKVLVSHGVGEGLEANLYFLSFIWYETDTFAIVSGLFLAEMSIDRAIAVTYPMKASALCTASRATKIVLVTCASQMIFNIQAFFTYKLASPPNGVVIRDLPKSRWLETFLNLYQLIVGTIIPFSILIISNTVIIFAVRRAASNRQKITSEPSNKKEANLTLLLLMTSFAFLVCSIPKRFYESVITDHGGDPYWAAQYWMIWWFCTEMWHMNFAVNFYVYFMGGGQKFRRDAKEILLQICRKVDR